MKCPYCNETIEILVEAINHLNDIVSELVSTNDTDGDDLISIDFKVKRILKRIYPDYDDILRDYYLKDYASAVHQVSGSVKGGFGNQYRAEAIERQTNFNNRVNQRINILNGVLFDLNHFGDPNEMVIFTEKELQGQLGPDWLRIKGNIKQTRESRQ